MRTIGVAIPLTLLLLGMAAFIACTREPVSQANNAALTDKAEEASLAPSTECQGTQAQKLIKLKARYENSNTDIGDPDLNGQWKNNFVNISIEDDPVWGIAMRIKGKISRNDSPRKLSKFVKFFEKHLEKGCIQRVSFESMAVASSGFEWTICDDPQRPCPPPDGECGHCAGNVGSNRTPTPTPPANTNSSVREIPNRSNQSNTNSGP